MKPRDGARLVLIGAILWAAGTLYYGYRGPAVFESGPMQYWLNFSISPLICAAVFVAILRRRGVQPAQSGLGMLFLIAPGMAGEALVFTTFSTFLPRLRPETVGPYAAFLFAGYAVILGIAAVLNLRAAKSTTAN